MNAKYQFNPTKVYNTFNAEELLHRLNLGEKIKGVGFWTYNELIEKLQKLYDDEEVYKGVFIGEVVDVRVLDCTSFYLKTTVATFGTPYFYDMSDVEYKHDFNSYPQANEN